jgi:hypothetical protein
MALDLIKNFSNKSWVSKRLWKTIKGLKEIGPKLGLSSPELTQNGVGIVGDDPHSSAALAMAGLAGHEIGGMNGPNSNPGMYDGRGASDGPVVRLRERVRENGGHNGSGSSPVDGTQMSTEMTNLFEAALGSASGYTSAPMQDGEGVNGSGGSHAFGGDEELYRQLRDLF